MKRPSFEFIVGLFVLVGLACFSGMTLQVGRRHLLEHTGYELSALFSNVGGLKNGAPVYIAGVEVGRVKRIWLEDYQASVLMAIAQETEIQEDAIASVKTRGLLGQTFVEISPGGSDVVLKPGEQIQDTQPHIDLQSLIAKYVFSEKSGEQ